MTHPAARVPWPGRARVGLRLRRGSWLVATLALSLSGGASQAQTVSQVDDLFTGAGVDAGSMEGAENGVLGGSTYFAAQGSDGGRELWVTDGTAVGTRQFADICPGACSSSPADFHVEAGHLFFSADDGWRGRELWTLLSGASVPVLVRDIFAGASGSSPRDFRRVGVRIGSILVQRTYFSATNAGHGRELWRLNAASAAVQLEADIEPGPAGSSPLVIGPLGQVGANSPRVLLLATRSPVGREPFVLNYGTPTAVPDSVELLRDLVFNGQTFAGTTLNGFAVFVVANDSEQDDERQELWVSHGSSATTGMAMTARQIGQPVAHPGLARVFFAASVDQDRELYATVGNVSGAGTGRVRDIRPGLNSSNPEGLVVRGPHLLFLANDGATGRELWRSDGTSAGTTLVAQVVPGSGGISTGFDTVLDVTADGSRVYFGHLGQLWRSDGTGAGTSLVSTLSGGTIHALRATSLARVLISQDLTGLEPFFSDGTGPGTVPLGNLNTSIGDAHPETTAPAGGRMIFSALSDEGAGGRDMWSTLGNPGDPQLFHPAEVHAIGPLGDRVLAVRPLGDDYVHTDGTLATTTVFPGPRFRPRLGDFGQPGFGCAALMGGSLYFVAQASFEDGPELFRSDGSEAGTVAVTDLSDAAIDAFRTCTENDEEDIVALNGKVLFQARLNAATGTELLSSNGIAPPQLVADINPGPASGRIRAMTRVGNRVVFVADDPIHGTEPWVTDGTAQGTQLLKDIAPGSAGSQVSQLVLAGAQVFFVARSPEAGRELWASDGTPAGTRLVIDLFNGPGDAFGEVAMVGNGRQVFFAATASSTTFCPLFMSNGTAGGTRCAIIVEPFGNAMRPTRELVALANGAIVFSAWSPDEGEEIRAWRAGLQALDLVGNDIRPGSAGSEPSRLLATGSGRVFFSADDGSTGRELWTLDLSDFLFTDSFD